MGRSGRQGRGSKGLLGDRRGQAHVAHPEHVAVVPESHHGRVDKLTEVVVPCCRGCSGRANATVKVGLRVGRL